VKVKSYSSNSYACKEDMTPLFVTLSSMINNFLYPPPKLKIYFPLKSCKHSQAPFVSSFIMKTSPN